MPLNKPSPAHLLMAEHLVAHEGAAAGPADTAPAARVFDKLCVHLAPLLGDAGVQLLFVRSAKLVGGEFASLAEISVFERSARLRALLEADDVVDVHTSELFSPRSSR